MQNIRNTRNVQNTQNIRDAKNTRNTRDAKNTRNTQDAKNTSEGLIADSDLDDIDAASQCKSCKTYSSDPPYYLIVSLLNSCPSCKTLEPGVNRCYICYYAEKKNGVCYCTARTIDNDPYR